MIKSQAGVAHILFLILILIGIGIGLYLVQNPQIFSPRAAENGGTGQISVSPDPCLIPSGQSLCSVVVTWSTANAVAPVQVRIRDTPKTLFASGPSGSQTAPWVTGYGVTFDLYENNGTRLLASVFAKGGINTGTISASPYPCIIRAGQTTCTTTITWSSEFVQDPVQVKVRETGEIFATGRSGTANASWVTTTPRTLDLYHDNGRLLLSSYIVKGVAGTVTPSPSSTQKLGDIDKDGDIDIFDYNTFLSDYQPQNLRSDIDKNGRVDIFDYNLILQNFGK